MEPTEGFPQRAPSRVGQTPSLLGRTAGLACPGPDRRIFSGLRTLEAEPGGALTGSAIPACSNPESQEHPSGKAVGAFETLQ